MLAIFNSGLLASRHRRFRFLRPGGSLIARTVKATLLIVIGCGSICNTVVGGEPDPSLSSLSPLERAGRIVRESEARFKNSPTNAAAAWQFARACFDLAELATKDNERAALSQRGMDACRQLLGRDPQNAAAHYYLALNLGQLARTKSLGALKLLGEMEREATAVLALDAGFDYSGADRFLGMLYNEAPGWPASLGSRKKAKAHLLDAIRRNPDYPGNRLYLLEAHLQWGDRKFVQAELGAMEKIMEEGRVKFVGEEWAESWRDWDKRWSKVKRKAALNPLSSAKQRDQ